MKCGVLVISHGSRDAQWNRLVDEAVAGLRLPEEMPVCSSFLEIVEGRLIQDGIDRLEEQGVGDLIVVPLFVSSGSTHMDEIRWAFGLQPTPKRRAELKPFRVNARVLMCSPIDDDPDIAQIVYEKLKPLSVDPKREAVLLLGHGSMEKGFHLAWRQGLERLAARIRELGGFAGAEAAMLLPDQIAWKMKRIRSLHPHARVIAAPLFVSEGYFTRTVIPKRIDGYDIHYNGKALLPHPLLTVWMEREIAKALKDGEACRNERD